jgi:hypothetical protein
LWGADLVRIGGGALSCAGGLGENAKVSVRGGGR